jgi:hypothetical protein
MVELSFGTPSEFIKDKEEELKRKNISLKKKI